MERHAEIQCVQDAHGRSDTVCTSISPFEPRLRTQSTVTTRIPRGPVHRSFVIGGASLYRDTLALVPSSGSFVDRILLTRILSPAFEDCDVFMPDFLEDVSGSRLWRRASHEELREWVGCDVVVGAQEENGVQYEFQMWVR